MPSLVLYVAWELGMWPPWGKDTVEELLKTKSLKRCLSSFISVLSHSGDVGGPEPEVRQHEGKVRGHRREGIEKLGSLFEHGENMEDVQRTWQPARQPKAAIVCTEPMRTYSLSPSIP